MPSQKSIKNSLVLDHFYSGFSADDFTDLQQLFRRFQGVTIRTIKSGKDTWSGIYIVSNVGSYSEFLLRSDIQYGLGCAFTTKAPPAFRIPRVVLDLLPFRFSKESRRLNKGKTSVRWFDSYVRLAPNSQKSRYSGIWAWMMHYHQRDSKHFNKSLFPHSSVDRFLEMKMTMGKKLLDHLLHHFAWTPGQIYRSRDRIKITISNRDFSEFAVNIRLKEGDAVPEFESLKFSLSPFVKLKSVKGKRFALIVSKGFGTLVRR